MKKSFFTLLIATLSLAIFFGGCTTPQTQDQTTKTTTPVNDTKEETTPSSETTKETTTEVKKYSMSEISKHSTKGDCWLLIDGKVYDVSAYEIHPGGDAFLKGCGIDATTMFKTDPPHSDKAWSYLPGFEIGELETS